ncbi:MAG: nucleotidyltransferase domain-containing protein [Gammaproteobacteria bacterium]|nr:nucleotidyltransferase domain-containing protein [Gammaproteobacteria bacterium]MDE0301692.1 nucleotidyltransferase domain-containing protein [Gammaproteobacteria bacterium]
MGIKTSALLPRPTRRKADAVHRIEPVGLADALFTTTQQKVLGLLFGQPERSFYTKELIRLAGSGSGAVQRELRCLASSGLIRMTRIGRQVHYQANPDGPVYRELVEIMRKTVALTEPIRQALDPLASRINLAMVFGSVARGTDTADSDIDLLVVSNDLMWHELYVALQPIETRLDREISPALYTVQEFNANRASGNPFLSRVLAREHLVLVGEEDGALAA